MLGDIMKWNLNYIQKNARPSFNFEETLVYDEKLVHKLNGVDGIKDIKVKGKLKYSEINAISTEARQKLERIDPETVAQAARIPGISPSDINILLLLLGR